MRMQKTNARPLMESVAGGLVARRSMGRGGPGTGEEGREIMATRKTLLDTPAMPSTLDHPVGPRRAGAFPSLDAEARNQVYRQWRVKFRRKCWRNNSAGASR